jgi:hypothetical protein
MWSQRLLRKYFEAFGTVETVNVFYGPMGPMNGGFAYVTFDDLSTRVSVLSQSEHKIEGAAMNVKQSSKPVVSKKEKGKARRGKKARGVEKLQPKPKPKLMPDSPIFVPSQVIVQRGQPQSNSRPQSANKTNDAAEIQLMPRSKDVLASECPASPLSPARRCIGSPVLARRSMNPPQSNNVFASPLSGLRRSLPVNQNVPTQEKSFGELGGTTSKNPGAAMSKLKQLAAKQATRPHSNDRPFSSAGESHNFLGFLG